MLIKPYISIYVPKSLLLIQVHFLVLQFVGKFQDFGVLMIPTVPGPPPKLQTKPSELDVFRARAFSLLSIVGVSGFCQVVPMCVFVKQLHSYFFIILIWFFPNTLQVNIPLGMYNDLPVSVSLVARNGADGFLLHLVENIYDNIEK